jgi:hypothetical protein
MSSAAAAASGAEISRVWNTQDQMLKSVIPLLLEPSMSLVSGTHPVKPFGPEGEFNKVGRSAHFISGPPVSQTRKQLTPVRFSLSLSRCRAVRWVSRS